jgi:hypothetical protein
VRRYTPFKRDVKIDEAQLVPFEGFPTYYLSHDWQGLRNKPVAPANLEVWLEHLFPERDSTMDMLLLNKPEASLAELRQQYLGARPGYKSIPEASVSDGSIDSDGVVGLDSGLGLFLETPENDYFSHEKLWKIDDDTRVNKTVRGSWYRIYDHRYPQDETGFFPWEWGNHSFVQYDPKVAEWLRVNLLEQAGPYVSDLSVSSWARE